MNHFHAAGGLGFMIGELLEAGLLHGDVRTVAGDGLARYTREPVLGDDGLAWREGTRASLNDRILRPAAAPFQRSGGAGRAHRHSRPGGDQDLGGQT